jgi:hypothetical protein
MTACAAPPMAAIEASAIDCHVVQSQALPSFAIALIVRRCLWYTSVGHHQFATLWRVHNEDVLSPWLWRP